MEGSRYRDREEQQASEKEFNSPLFEGINKAIRKLEDNGRPKSTELVQLELTKNLKDFDSDDIIAYMKNKEAQRRRGNELEHMKAVVESRGDKPSIGSIDI